MLKKIMAAALTAAVAVAAAMLFSSVFSADGDIGAALPERVTLYRKEAGEIVTLPYEELLVGCIFAQAELADEVVFSEDELLRAIACVINSRCLYMLRDGVRTNGADLCDTDLPWMSPDEVREEYGRSSGTYRRSLSEAAEYGAHHVLTFNDELILPQMCAYSTGRTEDGGVPYLPPRTLQADRDSDAALSTAAFSADTVRRVLSEVTGVSSLGARPAEWFSDAEYTDGGTLRSVRFGTARLNGGQLRDVFSLRSSAITIAYAEERFLFTVRGWGGNTGMSIHAAAQMAKSGSTAEEILLYFFAPAEVDELP